METRAFDRTLVNVEDSRERLFGRLMARKLSRKQI